MATQIYLCDNRDGVHVKDRLIANVNQDISIVASNIILDYYIAEIGDILLFDMTSTSFCYAIKLINHNDAFPLMYTVGLTDILDRDYLDPAKIHAETDKDKADEYRNLLTNTCVDLKDEDISKSSYLWNVIDASQYSLRSFGYPNKIKDIDMVKNILSIGSNILYSKSDNSKLSHDNIDLKTLAFSLLNLV